MKGCNRTVAVLVVGLSWCFFLLLQVSGKRSRKLESDCSPIDFHYEFTDCDADGGRWRVAVPNNPACQAFLPTQPPKRLDECFKSCEAGQFLNLTTLECENCGGGTYSLGGGVVFDEWDPLPTGFKIEAEKFRSVFSSIGRQFSSVNCSKWGWKPRKDMIASQGGPCVANLIYTTQLVKPGKLKFTYQYADDSVLFEFQANSDQWESLRAAEGSRWPGLTGDGVWRTEEISLHPGLNIFQWKTMGMEPSRRSSKPIMIKRIEIEGVGYTSSCNPCPAGTFADREASKTCLLCPNNTFSPHQSTNCKPCDTSNFYSEEGSEKCLERPPCSETDYLQVHEPCRNNRTRITYRWIPPKICLESKPGAISLPPKGNYVACPPCNAGTEYRDGSGSCEACRGRNEYSDGSSQCTECPANTKPRKGHFLTQWYSWPPEVHTTCISPEESGCSNSPAWELHGNYTQSGRGHEKWVYLVMTLSIGGFQGVGRIINGEIHEIGRLSFTFEMKCRHDCELLFMQGTSSKNATVIQRWTGTHAQEEISHLIYRNDSYDFSWAFQKLAWDAPLQDDLEDHDENNYVRIYEIVVQNTIDGGASSCTPCQDVVTLGHNLDLCLACDDTDSQGLRGQGSSSSASSSSNASKCLPCPPRHVRVDSFSSDSSSCRECGPGLITENGFDCITDCTIKRDDLTFDLRPLQGIYTVRGSSLFTASGTQYYHVFNVSVCSDSYATCEKNVSLQHGVDTSSRVESLVCQSTIFPPALPSLDGLSNMIDLEVMRPLSTHASSLGDHLAGITPTPSALGVPTPDSIRDELINNTFQQLHFVYTTPERTIACPQGRNTTITFRCKSSPSSTWDFLTNNNTLSPSSVDKGVLKAFDRCSDGTCDGCNFHFLWETPYACHLCTDKELVTVRGECKNGVQDVHYFPSRNSQCLPRIPTSWPTVQKCQNHLPFVWEVAIEVAGGLALVLTLILICFWRRHRRLEYKYMKLVASGPSGGRGQKRRGRNLLNSSTANHGDGDHSFDDKDPDDDHYDSNSLERESEMMPVAESCGLDPNEDSEEEDSIYDRENPSGSKMDEVRFHSSSDGMLMSTSSGGSGGGGGGAIKNLVSRISIFDRLKSLTHKGELGSSMEIMNLTDKEAYS